MYNIYVFKSTIEIFKVDISMHSFSAECFRKSIVVTGQLVMLVALGNSISKI